MQEAEPAQRKWSLRIRFASAYLRRSMLFWLGLVGLTFLGWIWVRGALFQSSSIVTYTGSRHILSFQYDGDHFGFALISAHAPIPSTRSEPGWKRWDYTTAWAGMPTLSRLFPMPGIRMGSNSDSFSKNAGIAFAHWLATLIYAIAWISLLYWRLRQRRNSFRQEAEIGAIA